MESLENCEYSPTLSREMANILRSNAMERVLLLMPKHFSTEVQRALRTYLRDFEILELTGQESDDVISEAIKHSEYLLCAGVEITAELLSKGSKLRLIQKWGSGIDGIDLHAAEDLNIPVSNIPGGNANAVAEHFFSLLFALLKHLCKANASMHSGRWLQSSLIEEGIEEVSGKTMGIIGMGNIGRAIATRAQAFNIDIVYYKRSRLPQTLEHQYGLTYLSFHDLLKSVDIVALALPLDRSTNKLFGYRELCLLKPSAVLINVARGAIIDEDSLHRVLVEKRIAGAGLDVFEHEPVLPSNPLLQLDNVIATPHIAGRTRQAFSQISKACANNIMLVSNGGSPMYTVSSTKESQSKDQEASHG